MIVGRGSKAPSEVYRYTADFTEWLDADETITTITTPAVELQPNSWPGPWPASVMPPQPDPVPDDATPLTVATAVILPDGFYVQLFCQAGTDGNTYRITFVATGSTGRTKETCVDVAVRRSSVRVV